ncbi:hypothetical protein BVRB_3g065830 [Beta vulgaris subsp. vulgaris]|uniref:Rad60/SUMO-like domain-containing protein n=1 Tax=Beta vulgaris subsp. vulgaris TaxID=3555 RepID=A0A0J8CM74_BETVV|nr:hypothetical protein BVRB_3g065830 [Beta vulgaris subsp. vulgaris]
MADKIVIERQSAATAMNNINMLEKKKKEDHIRVKFVNQLNEETYFKVLPSSNIGKAFKAYCQHHNLNHQVAFTYNGDRVNPRLTYQDLDLEDGAEFDVFTHVGGGAAA